MHAVRCPACLADVGVAEADFGHPVACPLCGDVFTPTRPAASPEPAAAPPDRPPDGDPLDRPSRRRPRFEDDEDEGDFDLERPSRGRRPSRYRSRPVDIREAENLVQGPATGLMVTAGLGYALSALYLGLSLVIMAGGLGPGPGGGPGAAPGQAFVDVIEQVASGLMGVVTSSVILVGATRMRKLQGHTFGVVAAVVALLPCVSPCCIVGLPIGIWALTTLNKPEVKDAFRAVAERGEE
jgi:hypothetical protein